jgi:hypothetical protein
MKCSFLALTHLMNSVKWLAPPSTTNEEELNENQFLLHQLMFPFNRKVKNLLHVTKYHP